MVMLSPNGPQVEIVRRYKKLVREFVIATGKSVTAGDVVSFLDSYIARPATPIIGEAYYNSARSDYMDLPPFPPKNL